MSQSLADVTLLTLTGSHEVGEEGFRSVPTYIQFIWGSGKESEGRGVNQAMGIIHTLAAQCVTAFSPREREEPTHTQTHTAGEKDTDCSVCSPDIVHIWYGTLAPNSLHTPLPFTLYYFMLIEKYYIQHHLSLLPRHPTTDLNACVYLYRQVKTGGRVDDWLCVSVRACVSTCEVMFVCLCARNRGAYKSTHLAEIYRSCSPLTGPEL